jgi:uncharacterized membrane protein
MNATVLLTAIVQWLHILAGLTWLSAHLYGDFVVWPALLKRPPNEAQAAFAAVEKITRPLSIGSSSLVALLGIIRGTALGPVRSVEFVFTTAYGLTWLAALILVLVLMTWGATWYRRLPALVWDGDRKRPDAEQIVRRGAVTSTALLAAILACMVLMRFGM